MTATTSSWQVLADSIRFGRLFLSPRKDKSDQLYDLISNYIRLGKTTEYMNFGYWRGAASYDEAASQLARLLGEVADLQSATDVLDVGFGFGDQDLQWAEAFPHLHIKGINVAARQIARANERLETSQARGRLEFLHGSATEMAFPDNRFDRVVSLEAAFHFAPRTKFFAEALRCLKPGGRLIVADTPVARGRAESGFQRKAIDYFNSSFLHIPPENFYDADVYVKHLTDAGFVDVHVNDITKDVFDPHHANIVQLAKNDVEFRARLHPLLRLVFMDEGASLSKAFDYVIVSAVKP